MFACGFKRIVDYDDDGAFVYMHIRLPSGVVDLRYVGVARLVFHVLKL